MSWRLNRETINKRRCELNRKHFPSEKWAEKKLNEKKLIGFKRNWPLLSKYFGDFVWRRSKIVLEIDRNSHIGKQEYDNIRDEELKKAGYKVFRVRFNNEKELEITIERIRSALPVSERSSAKQKKKFKRAPRKSLHKASHPLGVVITKSNFSYNSYISNKIRIKKGDVSFT